jgi:hypothetical protein
MLLLVVTSLEQFSDVGVGECSCNSMASLIMLWATVMEGNAVDILDVPTPSRTPKPPWGLARDIVSRWGFALSARPPGPACPCCGAHLGSSDRGNGGFCSARFSAAFHRPRRHESDLQGGTSPTPRSHHPLRVRMSSVSGKDRHYTAWSWGFLLKPALRCCWASALALILPPRYPGSSSPLKINHGRGA